MGRNREGNHTGSQEEAATWGPARENGGGGEELGKTQPNPNNGMAGVGEAALARKLSHA